MKTIPKLGDYFYYPDNSDKDYHKKCLRYKINHISKETFEFGTIYKGRIGWGFITELENNPNKKSKVKWVFYPKERVIE